MSNEGYVKYKCNWDASPIEIPEPLLKSLNLWRNKLYELSLIGAYENGIGYGNISIRNDGISFFVTGSATGIKAVLQPDDYALVHDWHFHKNELSCTGKTKSSSESLTHAAIYESDPDIHSIVHVHSETIWNYYLNKLPTSFPEIEYGTPGMAFEIKRLLQIKKNMDHGVIIMGGHKDGILSFGRNLDEACNRMINLFYQSRNSSTISIPGSK